MSLFQRKIINQNNKQLKIGNEPFFKSVTLNSVNILKTSFSYLGENYSTGLYVPPIKNIEENDIVANFRNPTNKLIEDTNFTNLEIYNLGVINNSTQYLTGITTPENDINSPIVFNIICPEQCTFSVIAGNLPSGLALNSYNNNTATITGSVSNIDTNLLYYDFVIRVETPSGNYIDRYFRFIIDPSLVGIQWNTAWLNSLTSFTNLYEYNDQQVYPICYKANTISNVFSYLQLVNPYNLDVNYEILSNSLTQTDTIIPNGITLDEKNSLFKGIPSKNNSMGTYYFFSIKATINYNGNLISGNSTTDTSNTIFYFYIDTSNDNSNNAQSGNGSIIWETNSNLGSVYEQEPMFFEIHATSTNSNNITYTLINSTMSASMSLSEKGLVNGYATFTYGKNQLVSFTARANDGYITSDKVFYFTILGQHLTDDLINISIPLFYNETKILKEILYNPNIVPDENVFRLNDENFGRIENYKIDLVNSIKKTDLELLEKNLYQYYRPLNLRFGDFSYTKVNDPSGNYIYDVIYINIIDTNDNGNSFTNGSENIYYAQINSLKNGCHQWNIPEDTYQKTRIFPTNLYNMRNNILLTTNREGYQNNLATDEYQFPNGYQRGVGVDQNETLPLWMTSAFSGVWGKGIALVYLEKGYGEIVLNNIKNNNLINEIIGKQITINEFCLTTKEFSFTLFDVVNSDYTALGALTSFDSCASTDTNNTCIQLQPSMSSWTEFDYSVTQTSYFIKFPPGDTY